MAIYIAIKDDDADVVNLKLSAGLKPYLPNYRFIGPFSTKREAEKSIPNGYRYKGKKVETRGQA